MFLTIKLFKQKNLEIKITILKKLKESRLHIIFIFIYINVRQSDLTLIPLFLAGLNKFYEKKVL